MSVLDDEDSIRLLATVYSLLYVFTKMLHAAKQNVKDILVNSLNEDAALCQSISTY